MAYELINSGTVTPHRLHTVVRLVSRLKIIKRNDLYNWVQPQELNIGNQDTAKETVRAAVNCGLLKDDRENDFITMQPGISDLESVGEFRKWLQNRLFKKADRNEDNFLLNSFSAWYIVQDERIFQIAKDLHVHFNEEFFPDEEERSFNLVKSNSWKNWASFLGLGWFNKDNILVPDAHDRVEPYLNDLLPDAGKEIEFGIFCDHLADLCPELDRGENYMQLRQLAAKSNAVNRISLALSTALRVLDKEGKIKLIRRPDARINWSLYPSSMYIENITHIQLGEVSV